MDSTAENEDLKWNSHKLYSHYTKDIMQRSKHATNQGPFDSMPRQNWRTDKERVIFWFDYNCRGEKLLLYSNRLIYNDDDSNAEFSNQSKIVFE